MGTLTNAFKLLRLANIAVRRNPLFYGAARRQLAFLESADFETRRAWTRSRLDKVLRMASDTQYGRRVGGGSQLESWPLLEKASIRDDPESFHNGRGWRFVRATTGGTTGMPLRLIRSLESVAMEQACLDRLVGRMRANPESARLAVLRADSIKDPSDWDPPFWRTANGGRRLILSSHHLNPRTIAAYCGALDTFRPDVLWAYPSALESLCHLLMDSGKRVSIPHVLASSEVLNPEVWKLARQTLSCVVTDHYGQAERVAFAYAFEVGEFRFLPGYAHIELNGVDGVEGLYEIVGTALWNHAMSLVRYRTGDLVRLPLSCSVRELEEVTLGVRPFEGVLGRESDFVLSPEGGRIIGINHFPREVEHVRRIQVIQESLDQVRILVLAGQGYSSQDSERLLRNARNKLPASMRVTVEKAEELERTSLGKVPLVVRRPVVERLLRG